MKEVCSLLIFLVLQSCTQTNPDIIGLWEHKGSSGNVFGLNLKKDGSFVTYANKKALSSGQFTYSDGLITIIEDNGCKDSSGNKIKGTAELVFFATDSFRVEVIIDSCTERKNAVNGSRYGRVTKAE